MPLLRHPVFFFGCYPKRIALKLNLSLYFVNNCFESSGIVESEVGKNLTVDFDAGLVDKAHKLRVRKALYASGSVDTLNPKSAEVTLFVLTVAVSIGKTFFPSVLGNGPHIATATKVTAGEFQDFLTTST